MNKESKFNDVVGHVIVLRKLKQTKKKGNKNLKMKKKKIKTKLQRAKMTAPSHLETQSTSRIRTCCLFPYIVVRILAFVWYQSV